MSQKQVAELLAPAGTWDSMEAAVRCGADAVYMGVSQFNARRNAENFSMEDLCRAVAYCHGRGVRVYLTLNTLVRDNERQAALAVAEQAQRDGVDALIVQDMGLARDIHRRWPTLPLHASTQLSCHTPAGVRALQKQGFSRVVLAREMTQQEIRACVDTGCECEVFVHGALCMCVSGQCYLSAMLGGRSGNRGLCAQPCRLPFTAEEGRAGEGQAALSLRDLSLMAHIESLSRMGVASLKIEGRMKRPEYVAAAVNACDAARQGKPVDATLQEDLKAVFSRTGFTDGYYTGQRDAAMFGVRRKEDVVAAGAAQGRLRSYYSKEKPRVPVTMHLCVELGQPVQLTVSDGIRQRMEQGDVPETAVQRPLTEERARQQLEKTGGTPFYATTITCEIGTGLTVPAALLNRIRRQTLDGLLREREMAKPAYAMAQEVPVPEMPEKPTASPVRFYEITGRTPETVDLTLAVGSSPLTGNTRLFPSEPRQKPVWLARLSHAAQAPCGAADRHEVALWFLPLAEWEQAERLSPARWGVEVPRGLFGQEDALRRQLAAAKQGGAVAALCSNIGAVALAKEAGLAVIGGFGLNITNRGALEAYAEQGLSAATLSFELTLPQLAFARESTLPTGLFVYGRQPLMLMRNCPHRAEAGCEGCRGQGNAGLYDRKGTFFPVMCAGGCAELLNSVVLDVAADQKDLPDVAFHLFHFTDETKEQVQAVLDRYRKGIAATGKTTRGLYRRGVL